jgi:hypothetical protein
VLALGLLALFAGTCTAQHQHGNSEFEVFVATDALLGSGNPRPPADSDSWVEADVVFGVTHEQFRVFGEYYVTPDEHEFERLEVGYELVPDTLLWLGRFHQPGSAWNTEHHHGRYLQTSITRPTIESWEDEEGLIPQHITGLLLDSRIPVGSNSGIEVSDGAGVAPALNDGVYRPITIGNNPGRHGVSLTSRIAYLPDYAGTSSAGLLWGHDEVYLRNPAALASLRSNHAMLHVYGLYADWTADTWHFIGAAYYVDVGLDAQVRDESFISGYFQAEKQLPYKLTAYGRVEDSARMQDSRYVALFDDHSSDIDITLRRITGGLRWDFARRQALSAELCRVVSLDQRAVEFRVQWSAAIP